MLDVSLDVSQHPQLLQATPKFPQVLQGGVGGEIQERAREGQVVCPMFDFQPGGLLLRQAFGCFLGEG